MIKMIFSRSFNQASGFEHVSSLPCSGTNGSAALSCGANLTSNCWVDSLNSIQLARFTLTGPGAFKTTTQLPLLPVRKNLGAIGAPVNSYLAQEDIASGMPCPQFLELWQAAGKLKAPIVTTLRGREYVEYDSPYDVGLTGLIGYSSGYHAMMECGTLLMLGTGFSYTQFYPEKATVIQVDRRGENLGRRTRLDLGLIGDVKETLTALLGKLETKSDERHLRKFVDHYREVRKGLDELAVGHPGRKPIHPQYVARMIDEVAAEDAIFSCDVGTPTIWAAR